MTLIASGLGDEEYAADASLFPILNRARPADVWGYRKDAVTSFQIVSKTLASQATLNTFWAWGGPILLQFPAVYGWADRNYQPGQVKESRLSKDLRIPYRLWETPLTVIDAQAGGAQGNQLNNWCYIKGKYATWAGLTATGLTWGQIIEGLA